LLQICSHPGAVDPLYGEEPAKLLALDRLVREVVEEAKEKLVIWSYYRFSLEQIARRFARYGLVRIDGSVTGVDERVKAVRRFQEDPSVHIFLGNAAAAGAGITLTAARHAVYESFSNQAAHWLQSVDRIHRRGQDRQVTCHVLVADQTLEEREFQRLRDKERSARELLSDDYDEPITRERFLQDLGGDPVHEA
jgi:SNF2 family DNA or RNA helicase